MGASAIPQRSGWSAHELAAITSGTLANAAGDTHCSRIATDSRSIQAADVFLAISGEVYDGHDFCEQAVSAGAVLVITERPVDSLPCLVVDSTLDAYAAIAAEHLRSLRRDSGLKVVGITGSSGKTSTKDLIASVLAEHCRVVAPAGSLNNDIGLPATVLLADAQTDILVLEMGMRGLGHISRLCAIAPPDVSVVLNVGSAHIGEVGSVDGIALAKSELVRHASQGATAILNIDDDRVRAMAEMAVGPVVFFGSQSDAQVRAVDVRVDSSARAEFTLEIEGQAPVAVRLAISGAHQVMNALAAAAAASTLGMPAPAIAGALSRAQITSKWRMDVSHTAAGVTVINDAYNANPDSMSAALRALAATGSPQAVRWAVLADMLELGESAADEHERIGRLARELGISRLITLGENAADLVRGFEHGSSGHPAELAADWESAAALVSAGARPGDVVLVKASRGMRLERVAQQLIDSFGRVGS